jgi:hypothetical protein
MQRKVKWREKLPPEVLEYIDAYREAQIFCEIPQGDVETVMQVLQKRFQASAEEHVRKLPDLPVDAKNVLLLDQEQLDVLHSIGWEGLVLGENLVDAGIAETLETVFLVTGILKDDKNRVALGFLLALLYKSLTGILDPENTLESVARAFEFLAKVCRGKIEFRKDGPNIELINMVNLIRRNQRLRLTPKELHAAVNCAGLYRDDPGAFRVWLHLEENKGRVFKAFNESEIQIPFDKNGKIAFAAMSMTSRTELFKLMRNPVFLESLTLEKEKKTL